MAYSSNGLRLMGQFNLLAYLEASSRTRKAGILLIM
jgi:hypothetical protein